MNDLDPLSTDPAAFCFIDVETRSHEDVTMTAEDLFSSTDIALLLQACPETGALRWRERVAGLRVGSRVISLHGARVFNGKYLSRPVGIVGMHGYVLVGILGHTFAAHRLLWALCTGVWPACKVDHINGIRSDNRLLNLRLVNDTAHCRNSARPKNNTSGRVGVLFHARTQKWRAYISLGNRSIHLGMFDTFEAASDARARAETEHGFHPNHGRPSHE